ncbi:hypothetical protein BGZ58_001543 [Dissophora ornata]|nr:hypothetical protein BGZ58_001543 [Dissophora ornata]
MLSQRFRQKSSDHWVDQEKRDLGFNIMSPTGRSRTFKARDKNEEHFGARDPQNMDGVSFIYTKGPAGQTPFPTPIAMSGYFPQNQQQYAQSQFLSQQGYGCSPYPPLPQTTTQAHVQTPQAPATHPTLQENL